MCLVVFETSETRKARANYIPRRRRSGWNTSIGATANRIPMREGHIPCRADNIVGILNLGVSLCLIDTPSTSCIPKGVHLQIFLLENITGQGTAGRLPYSLESFRNHWIESRRLCLRRKPGRKKVARTKVCARTIVHVNHYDG